MAIATQPQAVTILGATGSIGQSTLDVIGRHPDRFRVEALVARSNWEQLRKLCLQYQPRHVALTDVQAARRLREALANEACAVEVLDGADAVSELAGSEDTDIVVAGIVGSAGTASHPVCRQGGEAGAACQQRGAGFGRRTVHGGGCGGRGHLAAGGQ